MEEFIKYMLDFYGKGALYDIGATREEILIATSFRLATCSWLGIRFEGDTGDREAVRDIIFMRRGL